MCTGRAGRRNSEYKVGIATCLNQRDIPFLQEALDMPLDDLLTKHAGACQSHSLLRMPRVLHPAVRRAPLISWTPGD